MKKKALLALILCAVLVLSGCTIRQKNPEVDAAQTILTVNGENIDKATVANALSYRAYDQTWSMYMNYGYNFNVTEDQVQNEVFADLTEKAVVDQKIREYGFDTLTEEEETAAREEGEYLYSYYYYLATMYGMPVSALSYMYDQQDIDTVEAFEDSAIRNVKLEKLKAEIVKDVALDESDNEAIQQYFDDELAAQKEEFTDAAAFVTAYDGGEISDIFYAPEGVRFVKQVLVGYTDDDTTLITEAENKLNDAQNALTDAENALEEAVAAAVTAEQDAYDAANAALTDANTALGELAEDADKTAAEALVTEAQTALDAAAKVLEDAKAAVEAPEAKAAVEAAQKALEDVEAERADVLAQAHANILPVAQEVVDKARAGEDLTALIEEYNSDPGMTSEPFSTTGYAICEGYTDFDAAFVDAGMALTVPGDISEPIESEYYGYYVLVYMSDLESGERTLDDVRAGVEASVLANKQSEVYSAAVQSWVDAAEVKTFTDRLSN